MCLIRHLGARFPAQIRSNLRHPPYVQSWRLLRCFCNFRCLRYVRSFLSGSLFLRLLRAVLSCSCLPPLEAERTSIRCAHELGACFAACLRYLAPSPAVGYGSHQQLLVHVLDVANRSLVSCTAHNKRPTVLPRPTALAFFGISLLATRLLTPKPTSCASTGRLDSTPPHVRHLAPLSNRYLL